MNQNLPELSVNTLLKFKSKVKDRANYNSDYELIDLVKAQNAKLTGEEYIVTCPICQLNKGQTYQKTKLYIHNSLQYGHCFVCNTTFLNHSKPNFKPILQKKVQLDEFQWPTLAYIGQDNQDKAALGYLQQRCPQLYSDFDFHKYGFYCLPNKVIINFQKKQQKYFYQIRYIDLNQSNGQRYYIPPVSEGKPIYIALGQYDPFAPTMLVEGVFTALVEKLLLGKDFNVLAILGHSISKYQLFLLKQLGIMNKIYIHMDTMQYSNDVRKELRDNFRNASVIPNWSEKLDSEELIREGHITVEHYRDFLLNNLQTRTSLCVY